VQSGWHQSLHFGVFAIADPGIEVVRGAVARGAIEYIDVEALSPRSVWNRADRILLPAWVTRIGSEARRQIRAVVDEQRNLAERTWQLVVVLLVVPGRQVLLVIGIEDASVIAETPSTVSVELACIDRIEKLDHEHIPLAFRGAHHRGGIGWIDRRESQRLQKSIGGHGANHPVGAIGKIERLAADTQQGQLIDVLHIPLGTPASRFGQLDEEKCWTIRWLRRSVLGGGAGHAERRQRRSAQKSGAPRHRDTGARCVRGSLPGSHSDRSFAANRGLHARASAVHLTVNGRKLIPRPAS
jgi:hypothetical protein